MDTTFILQPRQGGVSGQVGTGGPGLGAALETLLPTSEDKDGVRPAGVGALSLHEKTETRNSCCGGLGFWL
jgi:hypothetical protein